MALSMKNTLISLSLSGMMLFAGFLAGEQPVIAASSYAINQGQPTTQSSNQNIVNVEQVKKLNALSLHLISHSKDITCQWGCANEYSVE